MCVHFNVFTINIFTYTFKVHVICGTIAFGMGIDKPAVRFVIYTALSRSIERYFQESGRAGRNGAIADCILFYNCTDVQRIRRLIQLENQNPVYSTHLNNLFEMISFCENVTDCRRKLQLEYFGERFDRQQCMSNTITACDNCSYKVCHIHVYARTLCACMRACVSVSPPVDK